MTYPGVSGGTDSSVTLNARINPDGGGEVKTCEFEYVEEAKYNPAAANPFEEGKTAPCGQLQPFSGEVSAVISPVSPGTHYRYRLLAGNENGTTTEAVSQSFDLQAPSVSPFRPTNLSETTADLHAEVNPHGGEVETCEFEYGPDAGYGLSVPCEPGDIGSFEGEQPIAAHLTGLKQGVVYHFRVVATNPYGTTATEDQSFNFFPPNCPNAQLRQQTGTSFLPDCRAYELVSPGDAGGTILFPEGPQSSVATSPSRLSFGGILGEIPEADGEPPDVLGDLYVSTRTDTGWVTRYVGLPVTKTALVEGGPPNQQPWIEDTPSGALTDLNMDQFMDWVDPATGFAGSSYGYPGSYAPYLWSSTGSALGRLPSTLAEVPCEEAEVGIEGCSENRGERLVGGVKPSPEFNHYFFSSATAIPFDPADPNPLASAPGSAYDDNLEAGTVSLISKTPAGAPIEEGGGDFITFPGVSTSGFHILMSTGYSCNRGCDPNYDFQGQQFSSSRHVDAERHLFMRVGGGPAGVTHAIALGHAVEYVGMNAAATKVYFTSAEKLTPEAEDTSTNLYMWSENGELEGQPLTLISKPNGSSGTGTPVCPLASWTKECGAVAFLNAPSMFLPDSVLNDGPGGNGLSDNAIAAENGDVYFYSPAQLDGDNGVLGQQNLYDYRGGQVQYVTTFNTGTFCESSFNCSQGPMVRIQVSPDDTHMAFLTASKVTSYENAGFLEMYSYNPATGGIHCVSCLPSGAPPTSNVEASVNGIFMTNDGRVFFSTGDPLVPQDTDGIRDVYEYVEGRPQLISAGTGSKELGVSVNQTGLDRAGLVGVSAEGTDVYFSTYDTLVAKDRNGSALKLYDARTDGGFAESPASVPCAAAEECAGPGSSPPPVAQDSTGAELGTLGNAAPRARTHRKKSHKDNNHKKKRHGRRANANRGNDK